MKLTDLKIADQEIDFSLDLVSHFQVCLLQVSGLPLSAPPPKVTQLCKLTKPCPITVHFLSSPAVFTVFQYATISGCLLFAVAFHLESPQQLSIVSQSGYRLTFFPLLLIQLCILFGRF